jgi:hypothetical protein
VSWKEAKQMAKNSLLAKICDGPVLHLGTTGNDVDDGCSVHCSRVITDLYG